MQEGSRIVQLDSKDENVLMGLSNWVPRDIAYWFFTTIMDLRKSRNTKSLVKERRRGTNVTTMSMKFGLPRSFERGIPIVPVNVVVVVVTWVGR